MCNKINCFAFEQCSIKDTIQGECEHYKPKMSRQWLFDIEIICPLCGEHQMKYSDRNCPKRREELNEKYFIMLKFTELEYKIKELEKKLSCIMNE